MNNDCIFNILLYLDINDILNCLAINKTIKKISNEYFWKLLCERDYYDAITKLECNSYLDKYVLFHSVNKLKAIICENYSISRLFDVIDIRMYDHQFLKIITQTNMLNVLKKLVKLKTIFVIGDPLEFDKLEHIKIYTYRLGGDSESCDDL